ncbi:6-pyruvoyl-tetrahydropterin synthase-related protein [Cellulosilyticum sp. I15G10I2]|uniref:6-pyruvoyl-tetrahydropterin synthase-related protein n=1 Tax=Cellulosilyticum sp. I15G10I2 TaxID=1892843 RepID=UPI00085C3F95|nr:6-pyruvoyl-tetrahydropterin synthase-related protein [Cellulosilyticum sp. I15G10I2]
MKFKGYKYKFNLNASHSIFINHRPTASHLHTFEITLFVESFAEELILYDELENLVQQFLSSYEHRELGEIKPFDQIEPTLENMGTVFFEKLYVRLEAHQFKLVKLEIGETPSRIYIVNHPENRIDQTMLTQLLMQSMLDKATEEVVSQALKLQQSQIEDEPLKPIKQTQLTGFDDTYKSHRSDMREQGSSKNRLQGDMTGSIENNTSSSVKCSLGFKTILALVFLTISTIVLMFYVSQVEGGPWGADIYGHIFKADLVYQGIKNGNIYPLFTELWYNGIQPFRYWGPVPYYILAGCQALVGGSIAGGYLLFIGMTFFIGACGWLAWGIKENRIFLSLAFGMLWFFMPDNARVIFSEGNIPRIVITMLLPYLMFFVWEFVEHKHKRAAIGVILIMILSITSHLMIAAMIGIATFIFLLCYTIMHKEAEASFQIIIVMLLTFAVCGIWVYPALRGGLVAMDSEATSEVMRALSIPFTISLNPFLRLRSTGYFYYGLSIVIIAFIGVLLSHKKSQPGFIATLVIFLGTTTAFVPFLIKLPLNQLLWMMRFTPMAYSFFIIGMISWKTCKRSIVLTMLLLIALDSSLSFNLPLYTDEKPPKITSVLDMTKPITKQRILLLDNSLFGSFPSYYLGGEGEKVQYAYGWAWQGAATAKNIVLLNSAVEKGYYTYMFDRAIEMGCDTIIIRKASLEQTKNKWDDMLHAARISDYALYAETDESYIIRRQVEGAFGVVTHYEGLCIGRSATEIPLQYPYFEIGGSWNVEDYTLEDLSQYKLIYLSDFRYNNRLKAEKMLINLSRKGVKIVIDMNKIPVDLGTNRITFLGVSAQPITFHNNFGDLFFNNKLYKSTQFKEEYQDWNTVYLDNLSGVTGFSWIRNQKLAFMGNNQHENIIFVGFNLMFHAMFNQDPQIQQLLNEAIGIEPSWVPQRRLVSLEIKRDKNDLMIDVPEDNVNTTFAFLDAYESTKPIFKKNNLLHLNRGQTLIKITYPYLVEGTIVSLAGIIALIGVFVITNKKGRSK